jgi:hypothetical protein
MELKLIRKPPKLENILAKCHTNTQEQSLYKTYETVDCSYGSVVVQIQIHTGMLQEGDKLLVQIYPEP